GAGGLSRGVTTPVPHVYLPISLTAPDPSGSPGPTRLCRGCSRPPRRLPDQAASSFTPPLRRQRDGRLSPPSGPLRLVAHSYGAQASWTATPRKPGSTPRAFIASTPRRGWQ